MPTSPERRQKISRKNALIPGGLPKIQEMRNDPDPVIDALHAHLDRTSLDRLMTIQNNFYVSAIRVPQDAT